MHTIRAAPGGAESQRSGLVSLWESEELCDVTIVAGRREFKCHRAVLAAGSAYMRARCLSSMRDGSAAAIMELTDLDADSCEAIVNFLYKEECVVSEASLLPVLQAASRLEVTSLLRAGADFLGNKALSDPLSACAAWVLCREMHRPVEFAPLAEACQRAAEFDFSSFTSATEFPQLDSAQLALVLGSDDATVDNEIEVFDALIRWARAQSSVEPSVLGELLRCVRFECIGPVDLAEKVQPEPLFSGHPASAELLLEAFKYHALPADKRSTSRMRRLTWNPLDKHEWVQLSDDLLEVSLAGDHDPDDHAELNGLVRAKRGFTRGRHYWEFTCPNADTDGDGYPSIGVVAGDVPLGGDCLLAIGGSHGRGWGYYTAELEKVHMGTGNWDEGGPGFRDDDTTMRYGLLLDIEARTLSLYIDGVLEADFTHDNVGGVGPLYPAVEAGTLRNRTFRVNFCAPMPK